MYTCIVKKLVGYIINMGKTLAVGYIIHIGKTLAVGYIIHMGKTLAVGYIIHIGKTLAVQDLAHEKREKRKIRPATGHAACVNRNSKSHKIPQTLTQIKQRLQSSKKRKPALRANEPHSTPSRTLA